MAGQRGTIVSVDDDVYILKLVKTILQGSYEVKTYADSGRALESLEQGLVPDLIICDIDMPGMDGFKLNGAIRAMGHLQAVPFIFLTALSDRESFRKGMLQGADDYLTKPFSRAELSSAVEARLARASLLREVELSGFKLVSLGGVYVSHRGRHLQYEAKKVIELLLYLMTTGEKPLRHVTPELWWEAVVENNLHVLINRARKTFEGLAEFVVEKDLLSLRLLEPCSWDAAAFEAAAKTALEAAEYSKLEQAVALYQGIFLPDFDSPWSEQQRRYYEELYAQLLSHSLALAPSTAAQKSAQLRLKQFLNS